VLKLVVKDHGIAFDPTKYHETDVGATLEDRQVGGLGIHMIRSIMDTMSYERTADGYNVLTLTKKIG
jgi:sigma-B regulation protein RsbU (phosphoserine phosphatase)